MDERAPNRARTGAIVVGVDGEGYSDPAVHAAFQLGQKLRREVELVHAASVPHALWHHIGEAELAEARTRALVRLAERLEEAGLGDVGLGDRLRVLPGPPARALLERARELEASLILIGPHHKGGLFDFDNTVRAVLARTDCPVWVQPREFAEVRRMLVAYDLSEESRSALRAALELAVPLEASVTVLHCFVRPELGFVLGYPIPFPNSVVEAARETAQEEFEKHLETQDWMGVAHDSAFVEADASREVLERQWDCDLIVMGTHGRTGLSGAILGSVANAVLRESERPVLALRAHARDWLA